MGLYTHKLSQSSWHRVKNKWWFKVQKQQFNIYIIGYVNKYYVQKEGTQPRIPSLKSPRTKKVKGVFSTSL